MNLLIDLLAAEPPPAGGAELQQILIATAGATVVTLGLLFLVGGYRTERGTILLRLSGFSERVSGGRPGWLSIPVAVIVTSLILALFGMLWDMSLHIADGRDEGPLANPAHYYILVGLFGVFAAGVLAMALPRGRTGPTAVRIAGDWYAPLGGILITACGAFSLLGFPLDDFWHRIFGQDVTLWGPTHLMLIGGAAMTLLGLAVLLVEADATERTPHEPGWVAFLRHASLPGAFLLGLSTFQAEFDFGVPQFRFVFQPMLIMLASGAALVVARVWLGRGAALGAVLFFLLLRGAIALIVGEFHDEPTPYFPLYLGAALIVEGLAFIVPPQRAFAFGAWCGVLIGTLGMAIEWGWSHLFMPIPWPAELLPEAMLFGFPMAVAASILGAWVGARLAAARVPYQRSLSVAAAVSSALIAGLVGYALLKPANEGVRGTVTLEQVAGGGERTVDATVRLDPPDAADGSEWFMGAAWQGGGFITEPLEEVTPGVYRTTEPLPVHGTWKSMIRLHDGRSLTALPVYFPRDEAIPAAEIPAEPRFTRDFVSDHQLLQREQKDGVSPWLSVAAYGTVLAITLAFLALFAWAVHRIGMTMGGRAPGSAKTTGRSG